MNSDALVICMYLSQVFNLTQIGYGHDVTDLLELIVLKTICVTKEKS